MKPFHGDLENLTTSNANYEKVIYTSKHLQVVLMSLKPGEEIGEETHAADQFFRVEQGTGVFLLDKDVFIGRAGDAVVVPGGTLHNVSNKSKVTTLKLYTIYSPETDQSIGNQRIEADQHGHTAAKFNRIADQHDATFGH